MFYDFLAQSFEEVVHSLVVLGAGQGQDAVDALGVVGGLFVVDLLVLVQVTLVAHHGDDYYV